MLFWIIVIALTAAIGLILVTTVLRSGQGLGSAAAYDIQVYRDQLKEVDRDLDRGVVAPEDAERTRVEISRRILEADRAMGPGAKTGSAPAWTLPVAIVATLAMGGGAIWLYHDMGAPGYSDLPIAARIAAAEEARANRPSQADAVARAAAQRGPLPEPDARFADLMTQLRATMQERPEDIQGLTLLARNETGLGNFDAAIAAQRQIIKVRGEAAAASDYAGLAEIMIIAAGGLVTPEAEAELGRALQIDPADGLASYYIGLMLAQTGRPDQAFSVWRKLLEQSPADAPWQPTIRAQIDDLAMLAGVNYTPPVLPGPSADDIDAAQEMSPEDRQAMIRGMVDGLSDRLATEGGTAEEWARLIGALGVLGETDRAQAIWTEAQTVFADRGDDLALIQSAAARAGLVE